MIMTFYIDDECHGHMCAGIANLLIFIEQLKSSQFCITCM